MRGRQEAKKMGGLRTEEQLAMRVEIKRKVN